jgi:hypothetical protein
MEIPQDDDPLDQDERPDDEDDDSTRSTPQTGKTPTPRGSRGFPAPGDR